MWNEDRLESPLVGFKPHAGMAAADAFRLIERPFLELVIVRGDGASPAFRQAVRTATGVEVPTVPNTVAVGAEYSMFWMGPDEWLVQSSQPRNPTLEPVLRTGLTGQFASVTDVSSGNTVLRLTGSHVREVLRKGCPLDLHSRVFGIGQCAQSVYFKAGILLRPVADDIWEVMVRRSFADYLCHLLDDAASEYLA